MLLSSLSFEDLVAFNDIFKAFDITESDSKPPATMAVGIGAESVFHRKSTANQVASINILSDVALSDIFEALLLDIEEL